ncbi:MAG: AAA family ATPase [Phycisphaerae bacterium]|nr:AAA family ATPase [Phycisphaerae bacterium]
MRTLAVLNQKGGVGKTTTVANVAAALAKSGQRVLVIDLDPQAHLTIHLGTDPRQIARGSYQVLTASVPIAEAAAQVRENLCLLGASVDLVGAETELVSVVGREIILREALEPVADRFDYLLIDCPPSLGLLTLNALTAVQEVIIPLQPHFLALQGLGKLLETVAIVRKRINPKLSVSGILLCMFDRRVTLSTEVRNDIEKFLSSARGTDCAWSQAQVIPTAIRPNVKLAEAPSYGKTIFEYDDTCNGANDYRSVAEFIHHSLGKPIPAAPAVVEQSSQSSSESKPAEVIASPAEIPSPGISLAEPVATGIERPTEPQKPMVPDTPQFSAPTPSHATPVTPVSTVESIPTPISENVPVKPSESENISVTQV